MDFWIGRELVHHSVTMVQILRAVGLMAAIITKSAYPLIPVATLYPDSTPHRGAVFFVSPSFLYLQISAKFLEFLKSFSDFPVSYRLDNSKTVEIRNIFFTQTPSCPT